MLTIMNYFSKYSINKGIHKLRRTFNTPRIIARSTSDVSGLIEVIDIGRERQLLINGETHSFIMTRGKWNEVKRECWGYMSRSPFALTKQPRVLVCGLGGGSIIHLLDKSYHPAYFTAIEHDPEIVKLAMDYFSLNKIRNLSVIIGDANEALNNLSDSQEKFDLIIDDVFYVSARFNVEVQKDLIQLFTSLLAQNGVITFNRAIDTEEDIDKVEVFKNILSASGYRVKSKSIRQIGWNDIIYCQLKPL
ncbi:MAG: methyltransferase domain-containing protein [Bacteroidota bacterium]|nr:methyltransferase domain-containing protein [Bacteroidota bacterium]